jgi:hypothetical protein
VRHVRCASRRAALLRAAAARVVTNGMQNPASKRRRNRTFQPWRYQGLPVLKSAVCRAFALVWARFCSARAAEWGQIRRVRDTAGDMAPFTALRRSWLRTIVRGRRSDRGWAGSAGRRRATDQADAPSEPVRLGRRTTRRFGRRPLLREHGPELAGRYAEQPRQIGARQLAGAPRLEGHLPIPRRPRLRFAR